MGTSNDPVDQRECVHHGRHCNHTPPVPIYFRQTYHQLSKEGQEAELDGENGRPAQDQIYPVEFGEEIDLDQQSIDVVDSGPSIAEETERVQTRCFNEVDGGDCIEEKARRDGEGDAGEDQEPVVETETFVEVEADDETGYSKNDGGAERDAADDLEGRNLSVRL